MIEPEPGRTKISIRLDNRVIEHFRALVERAGGGNYQTLINDALVGQIQQTSMLDAVRQVLREEISAGKSGRLGSRRSAGSTNRKVAAGKR